jgi:hypothetical protein
MLHDACAPIFDFDEWARAGGLCSVLCPVPAFILLLSSSSSNINPAPPPISHPILHRFLPRSSFPRPSYFISTSLFLFPPSRIFPLRILPHTSNRELNTDIFAVRTPLPRPVRLVWRLVPRRRRHPLGQLVEPGEESGVGGVGTLRGWGGVFILFYYSFMVSVFGGIFLSRRPASQCQDTEYHR